VRIATEILLGKIWCSCWKLYVVKPACYYIVCSYVLHFFFDTMHVFISTVRRVTYQLGTTISVCDGWQTEYTCPLNGSINSDDVQWYRGNRGTNTRVSIDQNGLNAYFLAEDGNTVLTIENTPRAYDGYLWVEASSQRFCYTSITVLPSTHVNTSSS